MPGTSTDIGPAYLAEAARQLDASREKILHCVDQLNDDQLWWRAGEDFNSIANLLLHVSGNVRQRILTLLGGAPDIRNRAAEFAERGPIPKNDLMRLLDSTLSEAVALIAGLDPERLLETRRYTMLAGEVENTVLSLILQTVAHVAAHTQEIVAVTRLQLRESYRFMQPALAPRPRV